jgi:hypothetical protein
VPVALRAGLILGLACWMVAGIVVAIHDGGSEVGGRCGEGEKAAGGGEEIEPLLHRRLPWGMASALAPGSDESKCSGHWRPPAMASEESGATGSQRRWIELRR